MMEKDKEIAYCKDYTDKAYTLAEMEKMLMSGEFADNDHMPAYNTAGECLRWVSGKYIKQLIADET